MQAGDYLVSGMTQMSSPNNTVLVEGDNDLPTAYDLSRQIQLTPLSGWQPSQPVP